MRARVVIGANFGDEGKGLVTDYLCSQGAGVVVRFNGGGQAGHTVVTPEGMRHVFSHIGSGAFLEVPTFLSQFFIINPIVFFKELDQLRALGVSPAVFAHPDCLVTTFADMLINQRLEDSRGTTRHGSVGLGINETHVRSEVPTLRITMADLWNNVNLRPRLEEICNGWAEFRSGNVIPDADKMIEAFMHGCERFAALIQPLGIGQCLKLDPVFEGAQGLLLDQGNAANFPHVTRSNTGIQNVRALLAGVTDPTIEAYYVSRTYLTRHGAGPLIGENAGMQFPDDTNLAHDYQGSLRFAPLDLAALAARCGDDFGSEEYRLVLTHCDQCPPRNEGWVIPAALYSYGPTRDDLRRTP